MPAPAEMVRRTLEQDSGRLSDYAILLGFLGTVASVYALAAWIALRAALRSLGARIPPGWIDRRRPRRVVLFLAAAGALCMAYGRWIESGWVETTRVRIPTSKLAPGSRPIRILHFTDAHCDGWGPNEEKLLEIARRERPDLILFTGDCLNNRDEGLAAFRRLASALGAPYGCYGVRGNWEVWFWTDLNPFRGTAIEELTGTPRMLEIRGTRLALSGVHYGGPYERALALLPQDTLNVFLYHTPDLIREPEMQAADLYLAGHTHGGQVCLPFYGALVTLSRYGKAYESGLYREGRCRMYVCRGLGMEGGIAPRVRFCCRPEVAILELVPEN